MEQFHNICGHVLWIMQYCIIIMEKRYAVIMNVEESKLKLDGGKVFIPFHTFFSIKRDSTFGKEGFYAWY